MRSVFFLLLFCLLASGAGAEPIGAGQLVDRVVAVISTGDSRGHRTLITLSDLELEARIALVSRGASLAADGPLAPETLKATLDWLIAEHLLLGEAEQLAVAVADPAELGAALETFRGKLEAAGGYERFLERNELTEAELSRVLRRQLVVDRYLASRLRLGATVSEAEVRTAYDARRSELGATSYADAREPLRVQLEKKRREEVVAALVDDLRSRAEVRVLHGFTGGTEGR
ncbi:hypothetical protein [Vulgatibacter incomptus]|uniref:Uncharacterized protein n=1 Tax=Vulgatibacter incomptus TaxID=1391653 RepID=A0A0K1P937_9BACT|nr:hypothetical protein [Vulgatibacter incomptus]AKU89931.1 hypothetical protein AKJ08_0318 [Vulgatibacter incomptus]